MKPGAITFLLSTLVAAPAAAQNLLHESDLTYLGSFRLPKGDHGIDHFDYARGFTAGNVYRDPAHAGAPTLFISGYLSAAYVSSTPSLAQVSIPDLADPNLVGLDGLNTAELFQGFADPSDGHSPLSGDGFCSYVVFQQKLIGTCSVVYDAAGSQSKSAFVNSSLDFSTPSAAGPYAMGSVAQTMFGSYATLVPPEWQEPLGTKVVAGNAPWSIISRNSAGPGLHTVDADALIGKPSSDTTLPSTPLAYYPCPDGNTAEQTKCHQTLGAWDSNLPDQTWNGVPVPSVTVTDPQNRSGLPVGNGGPVWTIPYNDSAMRVAGVLFADGTRSVLFFGKKGLGPYCYGPGTDDPLLTGTPSGDGVDPWCYDPESSNKGDHAYPYSYFVWAYDVNDYVAAKQGAKQPWDVVPYTGWTFSQFGNGGSLGGVAWDPTARRMYLLAPGTDGHQPLVHVYSVGGGSTSTGTGGTSGGGAGGDAGYAGSNTGLGNYGGGAGSSAGSPARSDSDEASGCSVHSDRKPSSIAALVSLLLMLVASGRRRCWGGR